ncbi:cysteine desulfurase family protein [Sphingomonas naphthae]|uniref:Cysteine desulfurase n=1 Tax=Sphingomonas naphthae TaxID=1813468 RepID=A0ABY7TQL8_9SPHN|nr:cysteine desulfurase family protein [Sphingomonas naphthae]WCT74922.1 cysteine desulfurase family protein [Sphingomonas naphthae]
MIYLDYQATTPLAPEAREAMLPYLGDLFGNPHSPHRMGREAAAAVEVARERILVALTGGAPKDMAAGRLVFTSGATEALNWTIKGCFAKLGGARPRIVTIATEHAAVLDSVRHLERLGAEVVVLPVDLHGQLDLDAARAAIDGRTALVVAMLVNNEIGVIHRIAEIGAHARAVGAVMLCDAVQGFGRVKVPVESCDLIAMSAHKIHGPKGIGALWVREGFAPEPLMHGGAQEGGLRSGTLSPALCAGFGVAADLARQRMVEDADHAYALFRRAREGLGEGWRLNGALARRWYGNLNVRADGLDAGRLIADLRGVALSAGSACASGSGRPSHVLRAIGLSDAEARGSIRLGFGRYTTPDEIDRAMALVNEAVARQRMFA